MSGVYVAPDGSLELWEQYERESLVFSYWRITYVPNDSYATFWTCRIQGCEETPQFWGREYLGEL